MEAVDRRQRCLLGILARHVIQMDSNEVPARVVDSAKACVLDLLGCMLGGSGASPARRVASLVRRQGGVAEATVVGCKARVPVEQAALANGTAAHALELDDIHRFAAGLHPGAVVIPAALAVSEHSSVSGRTFVSAVLAGYEVAGRVAMAVNLSHRQRGFFSTGTVGPMGAAAAAAKVLGLDHHETTAALSLAASQGAGFFEFLTDGSPVKTVQAGWAARNGVNAALLAKEGLEGPESALEGPEGFARAYSDEFLPDAIAAELGHRFQIENSCFKLYAACGHCFAPIDAALSVLPDLVRQVNQVGRTDDGAQIEWGRSLAQSIRFIEVRTYRAAAILDQRDPSCEMKAKFSIPYCVAAALVLGHVDLGAFSAERLALASVRGIGALVTVKEDERITEAFPERRTAELIVELKDGSRLTRIVDYPKGTPENPVSREELEVKFRQLAGMRLQPHECERAIRWVSALTDLESIAELVPVLGGRPCGRSGRRATRDENLASGRAAAWRDEC